MAVAKDVLRTIDYERELERMRWLQQQERDRALQQMAQMQNYNPPVQWTTATATAGIIHEWRMDDLYATPWIGPPATPVAKPAPAPVAVPLSELISNLMTGSKERIKLFL